MTGRELYARWCGPPLVVQGKEYPALDDWALLDSGEIANWERLARELTTDLQAARNDGVIECSEAMRDAWERREARRCPSTT